MIYQKPYIKKDETCVTAAVDVIPLPLINPISALFLQWDLETGVAEAAALADEVLVEILKNGSEVLCSMQYGQLAALDLLMHPRLYKVGDLGASAAGLYEVFVPFGRYLYDPNYYLDPRGFASLDLRITQPTHTATTTAVYNVIMLRMLEHPGPCVGHLRATTKKEYTAAAATEYIELDRAFPYLALLISEMNGADADILSVLSNVKVNVDAGKIYPIDEAAEELFMEESIRTGQTLEAAIETPTANTNFLTCNWGFPWISEEALLQAPRFGKLMLEVLGLADGTIRVAGVQLAK